MTGLLVGACPAVGGGLPIVAVESIDISAAEGRRMILGAGGPPTIEVWARDMFLPCDDCREPRARRSWSAVWNRGGNEKCTGDPGIEGGEFRPVSICQLEQVRIGRP